MADLLNPVRPESPYDTQFPPEMVQDAASLRRRRALVDLLLTRSLTPPPTPSSGGITIPISPLASLSGLASGGVAALAQRGLDRGEQDLAARYSGGLSDARGQVSDLIKSGDYAGASQVAGRWPALKTVSDKLMERQFPQYAIHPTYGPGGTEQPAAVNMNAPGTPPIPIGGMKTPPLHPVESIDASGQPVTAFANLQDPNIQPLPKPVALHAANVGGTTDLYNPYGPERTLTHTLDPNKVPTPEDIEADAKMISEYRKPGYGSAGGRMTPWQVATMRRVDELAGGKYQTSVYPIVKAAEMEFNQKNAPAVRAFGTFVGHVQAAKGLYNALDNPTDVYRINQARNFFQEEFGYPAPAALDTAKTFLAGEGVKAVTGAPGTWEDRKAVAERFSKSQSPAAFNAAADTAIKFGAEQLKGHLQQLKGMTKGMRGEAEFSNFLTPQARAAFVQAGGSLTPTRRASDQPGTAGTVLKFDAQGNPVQ